MSDAAAILIRVIPRAGRTGLAGRRGEALLVRVAAAPVEDAANDALIAFLAEMLNCPRRNISIISGRKNRDKRVRVAGLAPGELERRVLALTNRHLEP